MLHTLISCAQRGKSGTTHGTAASRDLPERRRTQKVLKDENKVTGPTDRLVKRSAQTLANALHSTGPKVAGIVRGKAWHRELARRLPLFRAYEHAEESDAIGQSLVHSDKRVVERTMARHRFCGT